MTPVAREPINLGWAFFLCLLVPGLGYLYIGRISRLFVILPAALVVFLVCGFTGVLSNPAAYTLISHNIYLELIFAVDCWLIGRHNLFPIQRQYMKLQWYVSYAVFVSALLVIGTNPFFTGYKIIYLSDNAMVPTLVSGDYIISDTKYYRDHPLQPDAIILLQTENSSETFVRRITGVTGNDITVTADNPKTKPDKFIIHPNNVIAYPRYILFSKDQNKIGIKVN